MVQAGYKTENSMFTRVMQKICYPFYKRFWWQWQRDIALQRGFTMDDFEVYSEKDLRRSPFMENIWRDSCHPYQWLMFKYRRLRYFKMDRVIQGTFMPEHVREECKKRTYVQTLGAVNEWETFLYKNYMSDLTPATYDTRGKINPIELFSQYGLFRNEAWEKLFYNEEEFDFIDPEDYEKYVVRPGGFDIETTEGRMQFENQINTMMQDFPGLVVPEGETFDYNAFYMKWSLIHGKDTSRFDQKALDEVYNSVKGLIEDKSAANELQQGPGDAKVGRSTLGTEWPERMTEERRQAFQN